MTGAGSTILYLPCFDFNLLPQRPQQLLWAIAEEGWDVIYCNVTQKEGTVFEKLSPHFTVCHQLAGLDLEKEYIMWWTHGPYLEKLSDFHLRMIVSDFADASVEEFAQFRQWNVAKATLADLVLCASDPIFSEISELTSNAVLVRNGVNVSFFDKVDGADKLDGEEIVRQWAKGTGKVVGFWGAVATWLDYDLLTYLAMSRPEYTFILVGPVHTKKAMEIAEKYDNFFLPGYTPYRFLPAWARCFDAAIIPFSNRGVTKAANPIKMYEYLASGLPVVSVDLPEIAEYELIERAGNHKDFLSKLDQVLQADESMEHRTRRRDLVKHETWKNRAKIVVGEMEKRLPGARLRSRGTSLEPVISGPVQKSIWDNIWRQNLETPSPPVWDPLSEKILRLFHNWLKDLKGRKMLEVGCGSGKISARMAMEGACVTLLDYSPNALCTAKEIFSRENLCGEFVEADMMKMPFEDNCYDIVWNAGVLEHYCTQDHLKVVREMARVCKPGGMVITLVMNAACLPYRLGKWFAETQGLWPWGVEYPVQSLWDVFDAAGLQDLREETLDFETGIDFLGYLPGGSGMIQLWQEWYRSLTPEEQKLFPGYLLATGGTV